jgi:hypothetical protein
MTTQLDLLKRSWCEESAPVVQRVMRGGLEFTTDDLHPLLPPPANKNWYGVLIAKLKKAGSIEYVGHRKSARAQANGRKVSVWKLK